VPTVCGANNRLGGLKLEGRLPNPVMLKITGGVEPVPKVSEPLRFPKTLGVKVTATVQDAPAASELVQGPTRPPVTEKLLLAATESVRLFALVLVTVTVCGSLAKPSAGLSNLKVVGLKVSGTVPPPEPVPLRLTSCVKFDGLATVADPLIDPFWVGWKVTAIVHVDFPASDAWHGLTVPGAFV
jgi:hypothetical protein